MDGPVWTQDGLGMDSGETLEGPGIDPRGTRDPPRLDHGWIRDGHNTFISYNIIVKETSDSLSLELQAYFL